MAYIDVSLLTGVSILAGIDPITREMFFSLSTVNTTVHPMDVYKEMRICRRLDENLRPYDSFLSSFGNVSKGGGKFTERYVVQNSGTRFVPYDSTHFLTINGTVITDDGQEGINCFDRTSLSVGAEVDLNYVPPQVEIIVLGSDLTEAHIAMLEDLWNERGLDSSDPTTYTESSTSSSRFTLNHTGDTRTSITTTRL